MRWGMHARHGVRSPLRSGQARSMREALRRDPVIWVGLFTLFAVALPYVVPLVSPQKLETYGALFAEIPLILVALTAFQFHLRRIDRVRERHFWNLWTAGFSFWMALRLLEIILPAELVKDVRVALLEDVLYVGFYLSIILALEIRPHRQAARSSATLQRRLGAAGAVVFTLGLLLYFAVIPATLDRGSYRTWIPSLLLYVVLDGYVVCRLASSRHACASSRWRAVYSWLLAAAVLWLVTDSIELLMRADVIPWVQYGTLLDLLWLTPLTTVVVAARVREHELAGPSEDPASHAQEARDDTQVLRNGPLVAYAIAFPLLHFGLNSVGLLDSSTRPARELCALAFLLVLAGMAFFSQRTVEADTPRLGREPTTARDALRAGERLYRTLVESVPHSIFLTDDRREGVFANRAWAELTGQSAEEVLGQGWAEALHPEDLPKVQVEWESAERAGGPFEGECRVRARDGSYRSFEYVVRPVRNGSGHLLGWVGVGIDVAERRNAEQKLLGSWEAAVEASRAKSRFLADMSHEMRTPLGVISGMTSLALKTDLSPQQREYADAIQSSAKELLRIVNEILDLSKIEAKKLELEAVPFRLAPLLNATLKMFSPRAQEKGLALLCELGDGVPEAVIGDPARLRQVVANLVANAVRFTDKGEVRVRVRRTPDDPTGEILQFAVADTGMGIAAEDQARIFEAFSQVGGPTARRSGGTGLGLAITAQLVELMGGQMSVESEEGKGATFHFTVRLPAQPAAEIRLAAGAEPLRGLPVLFVHGRSEGEQAVLEMLRSWGASVTEAGDVAAVLSSLRQASRGGTPFRLIVLDESVPGSGELMLARRRSDGLLWGTPRILMSAGRRSRAEEELDRAITRSLVRPVTPSDLLDAVQAVLSGHGAPWPAVAAVGQEETDEAHESAGGQPLLVLLAEDNPLSARFAVLALDKLGHRAQVVESGQQVLEALENRAFDVVFMDVQMPHMDGLTATRRIRERERVSGRHVPIIAMTANAMKGDDEKCLRAGMDDYLQKPFELGDLRAALERIGIGAPTGAPAPRPGMDAAFDPARLQQQLGDDPEAVAEVLQIFTKNGPAMLAAIQEAISSADAAGVQQAAHRLKGALLWIAANRAAKAARALEEMGRRADLRGGERALEAVRREVETLIVEIRSAPRA